MFTNERQTTERFRGGFLPDWVFRTIAALGHGPRSFALRVKRRTDWFTHGLTARKAMNVMAAVNAYAAKRAEIRFWPVFVMVDISPLCNLHCTVCLHAWPNGNPDLEKQRFDASQRMSVNQFARLADELKDHTLGVLLYYVGDPLMHPELAEICRITHAVGLNAHVSTNFSFSLRDEQLDELITSGLTHLTICVDGFTQQNYERTRVDGGLDRVAGNLRRACAIRRAHGRRFPRIEVQYIKYQHNLHEIEAAHKFYRALGVDQVHEVWGWLHNYTDRDPGKYDVFRPRRPRMLPRCHWPYLFTVVKYDGAVLPCCAFRLGHQYTDCDDPRDVGNTFKNSFWEIWTSPAYRTVRRFACDPTLAERDASLAEDFCHACPRLFETDYTERTCRFANEHTFEQLYTIGPDGRPRRRPETMPSPCGLGAPPPSCTPVHSEPGLGT